jgi:hypothetical protein
MADAVFRVAADVAEYIAGMARADAANKKTARSAANIGDAVGKSIIKVELLNRALNAAGRAVSSVMDKAAGVSVSAGDRALGLATSLGSLGVRDINATTRSLSSARGGTTAEQKAAFAKSLADANKQRRVALKPEEAEQALAAFTKFGEFAFGTGGQDLISGIAEGSSLSSLLAKGKGQFERIQTALTDPMSPAFLGLKGRLDDETARIAEEKNLVLQGGAVRADRSAMRVTAARDPGGPVSVAQGWLGDEAAVIADKALRAAGGGGDPRDISNNRIVNELIRLRSDVVSEFRQTKTQPTFSPEASR